jgi:hypothetical protein
VSNNAFDVLVLGMSQGTSASDRHLRHTDACREFLDASGDITERVGGVVKGHDSSRSRADAMSVTNPPLTSSRL